MYAFDFELFNPGTKNYDLVLVDNSSINAAKYGLYFWLESAGDGPLNQVRYNFNAAGGVPTNHLLEASLHFVDGNVEYDATGGYIIISYNESTPPEYSIEFDFMTTGNKRVEGRYKGTIQSFAGMNFDFQDDGVKIPIVGRNR